jgi:hypothetical protein
MAKVNKSLFTKENIDPIGSQIIKKYRPDFVLTIFIKGFFYAGGLLISFTLRKSYDLYTLTLSPP